MSVSKVKDGGTRDAGNNTSQPITVPAGGHALGNLVVVCASGGTNPVSIAVTDTRSNTWSTTEMFWDAGNFSWVTIAVAVLTVALQAGDSITMTLNTGSDVNAYSAEFTASNGFPVTASCVDQHTHHSNTSSTDWFPGSVTTTVASEVAIAAMCSDNNTGTNTPVGSWVEDRDVNAATGFRGLRVEHLILSSTGAVGGATTVGTNSANDDGPAAIVTVSESGGAPAFLPPPIRSKLVAVQTAAYW